MGTSVSPCQEVLAEMPLSVRAELLMHYKHGLTIVPFLLTLSNFEA
jgi:hypothetical protein